MPHYSLTQTVPPASEPLSVADAALQLRVDYSDDNTLISAIISAARAYVETFTGRQLMSATYQMQLDMFPTVATEFLRFYDIRLWDVIQTNNPLTIWLPRSPVASISSITYIDTAGVTQTMNPATDYITDLNSLAPRITPPVDGVWPDCQNRISCVTITFVAGYASAANIPPEIMAAMRLLIGELYESRSISIDGKLSENPIVKNLLWAQRIWTAA